MKKIIDYRIIEQYESLVLEKSVKELLERGYQPYGNIKVNISRINKEDEEMKLIQVMVKYEEKERLKVIYE